MKPEIDHNIFSETGCLSKNAILRYRDNKLPQAQKHAVERHLVDCPLCSEALEGFALIGNMDLSDEITKQVNELTHNSGGVSNNMNYWAVAASVTAIFLLSYFAYLQFNEVNDEKLAITEPQEAQHDEILKSSEKTLPVEVIESEPEKVTDIQKSPDVKIVPETKTPAITKLSLKEDDVINEIEDDNNLADIAATEQEEVNDHVNTLPENEMPNVGLKVNADVISGAGAMPYVSNITYVDNLKVIDYTSVEPKAVSTELSKSVPSLYQNKKQKNAVQKDELASEVSKPRKVQYLQLLAEPIELYNEGKYELAVARFNELLEINNNDENALFYKGMSFYHLKEYNRAIQSLSRVSKMKTTPFSEEALFYIAKSHLGLKQKKEAIAIFRSIVAAKGFYTEKANEELELLY